ncbi:thioredoxin-disulfide reductase [Chloroflexota bacterium]
MAEKSSYDVIIIGGGPAGLTAGIYTARARLSSLLIEKMLIGGQITNTDQVENFPGFVEGISGMDLTQKMHQQATRFGLETITAEVIGLEVKDDLKTVKTSEGDYTAGVVIIAGGSKQQRLGVPGEAEYTGKGVSYCATCDAPFFTDQPVAVVGGSDAALTEALHLAQFASKVVVIHRRDQLRATAILQERAFAESKIEFLWDSVVEKVNGEVFVTNLEINNVKTGQKSSLEVAGVFVSIGFQPDTGYLNGIIPLDSAGHIVTDEKTATDIPGIYAAGDIRSNSARQAITAAGDGATAAVHAHKFLTEK